MLCELKGTAKANNLEAGPTATQGGMDMAAYDLAVIGAGMGGLGAANRAATLGARVALIEAGKLGGT